LFLSSIYLAQTEPDDREDAVAVFNQAQDAHEKGDFGAAITLYKKALKILPEFAEAEYQCGAAYLSLHNNSEAERAFRKSIELRPDWTLAMTGLGSLLVQSGKYEEADSLLSHAVELDPLNFSAFAALAELKLKTKATPPVLAELLNKIIPLTSKANPSAALWSARAALENAAGKPVDAKASLANSLAIDPNNLFALTERAHIALAEGDTVRAAEAVDRIEKIASSTGATKLLRARVLAADGKPDDALKSIESLDPSTPGVAEFKADLIVAVTDNPSELEKLLATDQKNASVLGRLCKLERLANPSKALDYCRRAVEAEPNKIDHIVGYGAALVQARAFDSAVGLFRKLIAIAPDNSTAHANLASALFELKRYNEAKIEYQWLIARQPDLVAAYYLLGITHDHLAEYLDAMANYQQFLRLADPAKNQLEIDKVNLRIPSLQRQIRDSKGKRGELK
jgi:tetratricopeptide (TPR) repeat protein